MIPGQGRFPTLRLDDIESFVEKLSNDQFADKPFVFDNEDLVRFQPLFTQVSLSRIPNDTCSLRARFYRPGHLVPSRAGIRQPLGNVVHSPRLGHSERRLARIPR